MSYMINLAETQIINEIAKLLYDFLPGKPHPYADQTLSFPGVAQQVGVGQFWPGGSKLPSLTKLLLSTLDYRKNLFCTLILSIVQNGMIYRNNKGTPITREEIRRLNDLINKVGFKIPELWDPKLLESLPSIKVESINNQTLPQEFLTELKQKYNKLRNLEPQERGYAFERFLNAWFDCEGLLPRGPFRLIGEQIDGSFVINSDIYLLEAKWQDNQTPEADLLVFQGKVEGKSTWSRGLFVSHAGFTKEGQIGFSRGRSTNIIGMDGQDIYFILEGMMSLSDAIQRKARHAAETGEFYISVLSKPRKLMENEKCQNYPGTPGIKSSNCAMICAAVNYLWRSSLLTCTKFRCRRAAGQFTKTRRSFSP
jgi:hypothetical protein